MVYEDMERMETEETIRKTTAEEGAAEEEQVNLQLLSGKEWLALHRESWKMFKMRKEEEGRRREEKRREEVEERKEAAREEKIRMRKERRKKGLGSGGGGR